MKFIVCIKKTLQHTLAVLFCLVPLPGIYAFSFFLSTHPLQTSGVTLSNAYYKITAYADGISSIQVDPTGSFSYGTNITNGLLIDNLHSTNGSSVSTGSNYVYFENLLMIDGANSFTADWQITLDGKTLKNRTICTTNHVQPSQTVWIKYLTEIPLNPDGYITNYNGIIFKRFMTDAGQYLPIEMLKRRNSGTGIPRLFGCNNIYATGTEGYDINFTGNMYMGLPGTVHFPATGYDSYLIDTKINKSGPLGQTMTWDMDLELVPQTNRLQKIGIQVPTWGTTNSNVTVLLKKSPTGDTIKWQRFYNISPNQGWVWLNVSDLSPGKYYLEMATPTGMIGWYADTNLTIDAGAAYIDGVMTNGLTFWTKLVSSGGETNEIGASYTAPPKRLTSGHTFGQSFVIPDQVPEYYPEFFTSGSYEENQLLNEFAYHGSYMSLNTLASEMEEWMALKTAWSDTPLRTTVMNNLLNDAHPISSNGYVYTQGGLEGALLLELAGPEGLDTRYFRNNPMYILAAYRLYSWTGDTSFLTNMMPKLRDVLDFIKIDQHGNDGLAIIDADQHDGCNGSWGSSSWYFETLPFGYKDALLNVYYYAALRAMAELERALTRPVPAANLLALSETVKTNFNNTFWDASEGRYVGCVDIDGNAHDYGYAFINLQAISYGLADTNQQAAIFDWLDNGITSSGTNDTFSRWVISPRSSTIANPFPGTGVTNDWWRGGVNGNYDWESPTHNGGSCIQFLFYEMMARVSSLGASNAWTRFTEALGRYSEPDRCCGGMPLYRGETDINLLPLDTPYAETGVAPSSFIYAFLGADPDEVKLVLNPHVPDQLDYIGVKNLSYKGCRFDIKALHGQIEIKCSQNPDSKDVRVNMIPLPSGGDSYPTNRVEIKIF